MLILVDKQEKCVCRSFEKRRIHYAFHDVDGTHSLIRDWPPVMSLTLWDVIENGLPEDFDSEQNLKRLIAACGHRPLPETDRFCVDSAGLSALTQMEWAIRRAVESGTVTVECDREDNRRKIAEIHGGRELFDTPDSFQLAELLNSFAPRLFRFYEAVLNGYCRDQNLAIAKREPRRFQVPGSMAFLRFLKQQGVRNFFVTGAVVEPGTGMYEEVSTLGFIDVPDAPVEEIIGSNWNDKVPKNVIMKRLSERLGASGEEILVIGDGRSEISTGAEMGALNISRLPIDAERQRELHKHLGTHIIVADFFDASFLKILHGK